MTMADTAETIKKTADSAAKAQNQAQAHAAEFQAAGAKAMREGIDKSCLLYTSPSPRDRQKSRMPSSA